METNSAGRLGSMLAQIGEFPREQRADKLLFLQKTILVTGEMGVRTADGAREDEVVRQSTAEFMVQIAESRAVALDLTADEQAAIRAEGERWAALLGEMDNPEVLELAAEMAAEAASKGAGGVEVDFGDEER